MDYILLYLQLCWKQRDLDAIHACTSFLTSCNVSITNPDFQEVLHYLNVPLIRCFHIVFLHTSKSFSPFSASSSSPNCALSFCVGFSLPHSPFSLDATLLISNQGDSCERFFLLDVRASHRYRMSSHLKSPHTAEVSLSKHTSREPATHNDDLWVAVFSQRTAGKPRGCFGCNVESVAQ